MTKKLVWNNFNTSLTMFSNAHFDAFQGCKKLDFEWKYDNVCDER